MVDVDPSIEINEQVVVVNTKKQISFQIRIKYGHQEWHISRRYNDFYDLLERLKHVWPCNDLQIPGKSIFGGLDSLFMKNRQKQLCVFIKKLLITPKYLENTDVQCFLGLDEKKLELPCSLLSGTPQRINSSVDLGSTENKRATLNDFELLKTIGKGNFGKVYLAKNKMDGQMFAIKVLSKEMIKKRKEVSHVMCERNVLVKSLSHPFLCNLRYTFQSHGKLYFVLDYINGGELFYHIQRERTFTEPRACFYAAEIACALGYLHSENIIYRDLKPENILLDSQGHVVLTDFGLCKENIQSDTTTSTFCGTPEYLAPEVLRKEAYDFAVDWWCLGSVIYEMLYGLPPFYSQDHAQMYRAILEKPLKLRDVVSQSAKDILTGLLQKSKHDRLGSKEDFEELRRHSFFATINWTRLLARRISPPFIPSVSSQADTRNISPEFIGESVSRSVIFSVERLKFLNNAKVADETFSGFSYAPSSGLSS